MAQKTQPSKPSPRPSGKTAKKNPANNASEQNVSGQNAAEQISQVIATDTAPKTEAAPKAAPQTKSKPPKKVAAKSASKTAPAPVAKTSAEVPTKPVPVTKAEIKPEPKLQPKVDVKPALKLEAKAEVKPAPQAVSKPLGKQEKSAPASSVTPPATQTAPPQMPVPTPSPKPINEAPLALPQFLVQKHGIRNTANIFANLGAAQLYEHVLFLREGVISAGGAIAVETAPHFGLLGNYVTIVEEPISKESIAWNDAHKPFDQVKFNALKSRIAAYLQGKNIYVQDCFIGSDSRLRLPIRVVTEHASQSLAARNLFIEAAAHELKGFDPRMTILSVPNFKAVPEVDGTDSEAFAIIDFSQRLAIIGGTKHFGEIKNIAFTLMSYAMPHRKVLPLHSAAITGANSDTTLLLGRSGTGKTTLSTDGVRQMIGDDAHAWGDEGIFNFESGSSTSISTLLPSAEPLLNTVTRSFGTIVENAKLDPVSRIITTSDVQPSFAVYSRSSVAAFAPIAQKNRGIHPKHVILLTNDAFGVLPPVARLSHEQAVFFFLSGYTSFAPKTSEKNADNQPEASFSACMGEAQMIEDPLVYATLFREKLRRNRSNVWLVNTGWQGGSIGTGARIKLEHSRAILNAIMNGALQSVEYSIDPVFGVQIPATCQGLPAAMLNPRAAWADRTKYDQTAQTLATLLKENFKRFASAVEPMIADALNPAIQQIPPAKANVLASPATTTSASALSANIPSSSATPTSPTSSQNVPKVNAPSVNVSSASTFAPSAAQQAQRQMRVPQAPPKGRGKPNNNAAQQQNDVIPQIDEINENELGGTLSEPVPAGLFGRSDSPENAPEFRPTLDSALDAAFEGDEDSDNENDENEGENDGDASQDGQNQENAQFRGGRRRGGRGRGGRGRRR